MGRTYQYTFNISEISVQLQLQHEILIEEQFKLFLTDRKPDYIVLFQEVETLKNTEGQLYYEGTSYAAFGNDNSGFQRKFWDRARNKYLYSVATYNWKDKIIKVSYLAGEEKMFGCANACFFYIAWEAILMHERRIMLHSSFVETQQGALLFSGISGAGKTTQAELWCKYRKCKMLNGDRTILRWDNDELIGYGSPYAGSSKCYVDSNSQISAIIFPKKAAFCKASRLNEKAAFCRVFSGFTLNSWDKEFVEFACDMAKKIVEIVPCYELLCTPDKRAIDVLEDTFRRNIGHE